MNMFNICTLVAPSCVAAYCAK